MGMYLKKEENIFENLMISASTVSDNYAKTKSKISEEFHIEQQYELFKTFLVEIGEAADSGQLSMILSSSRFFLIS